MRSVESLLVNKGTGGSSGSQLDLETLESDVSSGKSAGAIAEDRGWPSSSARQRVAAIKRGDPSPRHAGGVERRWTPELLDEMREFIEEEHGRISVRTVAIRYTLSRFCSRKALRLLRVCSAPFAGLVTSVIVATWLKRCRRGWRLHLDGAPRGRFSSSRRLNLDVNCFSDKKIFKVDAAVPGHGLHTFSRGKQGRRNKCDLPFQDTPCEKGESHCHVCPF